MKSYASSVQTLGSARGVHSYRIEVRHDGLNKHREIKGAEHQTVVLKAQMQMTDWDQRWSVAEEKASTKQQKEDSKTEALARTAEAEAILQHLERLLQHTLEIDDRVDWNRLKRSAPFPEPEPTRSALPPRPAQQTLPEEPSVYDARFLPKLGILGRLIPAVREQRNRAAQAHFDEAHHYWQQENMRIMALCKMQEQEYQDRCAKLEAAFTQSWYEWQGRKAKYLQKQQQANEAVERQRQKYLAGDVPTLLEYCDMVLTASEYPDFMPKEFSLNYDPATKTIVVDYTLPAPSDLPTLKAVKYVASKDSFEEQHLSATQRNALYDQAVYQIALRTLHELFEADVAKALDACVFNGFVTTIDPRTGKSVTACILSVRATSEKFLELDLAKVDPKACFKELKGVGSSKLHGLAAVPPILQLATEDVRFVASHGVMEGIDDTTNLATMDWEEFEHLVREVFEKEFTGSGGTVKVTRASRDGGVDAIAFDPDPIRGGKIVIQAKRYTNTVGVAAVRDLYGTVINEGATKGILVTTADFGPDSYEFATGKPISLLNGANLLHLLERHGRKATIDIQAARRMM